jgi:hypothetical protein
MFSSWPLIQVEDATSGTASYTANTVTDFEAKGLRLDANHANKTVVASLHRGFYWAGGYIQGVGAPDTSPGTETLTEQRAVEITHNTQATTNRGIINASTTEWTPQTAVIAAATSLAVPTSTMITMTSAASVTWAGGGTLIADGQNGQCVVLMNVNSAARTITLTNGNNVNLPGAANFALAKLEGIQLCWLTATGTWVAIR